MQHQIEISAHTSDKACDELLLLDREADAALEASFVEHFALVVAIRCCGAGRG
jgi:hypothetical protein